jgi:hypothetical protein
MVSKWTAVAPGVAALIAVLYIIIKAAQNLLLGGMNE